MSLNLDRSFHKKDSIKGTLFRLNLFLLYTKAFSSLLHHAKTEGKIKGASICRNAPRISHLLFASDTLVYCLATESGVVAINDVLEVYGSHSPFVSVLLFVYPFGGFVYTLQ